MEYTKDTIAQKIFENTDAVYITDVGSDAYTALKDNEFFHRYFGDSGSFNVMMGMFMTNRIITETLNEKDDKSYNTAFKNANGFKEKFANKSRIRIDDKEYTISLTNYPLDEQKSALVLNVIAIEDYLQDDKKDDKAKIIESAYLFSMNVDLLADTCGNMSMSEVEDNSSVSDFNIPYLDWRQSITNMFHPDYVQTFLEYTDPDFLKENLKYHQTKSVDVQIRNLNGVFIWAKLIFNRIKTNDDSDFRFVFMIEDINESHSRMVDEMKTYENMAMTDSLTGLLNHGCIETALGKCLEESRKKNIPVSIIMFDIDHFKHVNDTYGHACGDQVLKSMASIASAFLLKNGGMLGRWGGEEFLGIHVSKNLDSMYKIAEELRGMIESYDFEDVHSLTSSFGVIEVSEDETAKDAFVRIDSALYQAKEGGRNRVVKG